MGRMFPNDDDDGGRWHGVFVLLNLYACDGGGGVPHSRLLL